jgi:diguanylate cyclase (GGDEF)-like protein
MEQIQPENWAFMQFGLIFLITCAQMTVVYALSGATNPTPGLGLYTVYFMAALLGWIAFTLQQGANIPMVIDIPSVASILNSYILFLAAGQRAGILGGRIPLGVICLGACLCVFFISPHNMFVVQVSAAALFFAAVGLLSAWRSWSKRNIGDAIIATAALMMVIGMPAALHQLLVKDSYLQAQAVVLGVYSTAYTLVVIGFLASVLLDYQQHLSHLTTEDPLTRLLNRRGMENALHVSLAHSSRHQLETSAIMVDIDGFSEVNNNFGPDVGDQVIRQIAQHLQRMSRASDVVARIGGEEFLLVLSHTSLHDARALAERMRGAIAERPLVVNRQRIAITVSIGVASTVGEVDLDALSARANRAVNQAKQGGRNRVASVEKKPVHLSTTASQA